MPNISQSKSNKTVTFGQLVEHNKRNIFLPKIMQNNEAGRLVPDVVDAVCSLVSIYDKLQLCI